MSRNGLYYLYFFSRDRVTACQAPLQHSSANLHRISSANSQVLQKRQSTTFDDRTSQRDADRSKCGSQGFSKKDLERCAEQTSKIFKG
eukprot:s223_g37.t1